MSSNASIKKNSIYNVIKTISLVVFPLITFPYVTRILEVENIGKINFGLSIVSYFSLIASLGINTYAIRECSKKKDNRENLSIIASEIYTINIIMTFFSYLILFFLLIFNSKVHNYRYLIIIQSLSIFFTTIGTDWINAAMEDFKYIAIRTIAFQFIGFILIFIFVKKTDDYLKYAVINLMANSGANILNVFYRKKFCDIHMVLNPNFNKHIIHILLMFVMLMAQNIFHNVDTTMLGVFGSDKQVGIYSSAHKIYMTISSLISSLLFVIIPRMSYYFEKKDYKSINILFNKILGYNLLIGIPAIVGMFMLSDEIVLMICGEKFMYASFVLKIFVVSFFFDLIGGMLIGNSLLLPSGNEKYYMFICCICAFINIVTNMVFIPKYGEVGAAITTGVSQICLFILLICKIDKKIIIVRLSNKIVTSICGAMTIIFICYLLKIVTNIYIRVLLSIILSSIFYFVIQLICKNDLVFSMYEVLVHKINNRR